MVQTEATDVVRRTSLVRSMILIAIFAADMAFLRSIEVRALPDPGIMVMVIVLEVGLWRKTARRARIVPEWVGFQLAGWAYVAVLVIYARPIRLLSAQFFLRVILGSPVFMDNRQRWAFFAISWGGQLAIALSLAMLGGFIAGRLWELIGSPESIEAIRERETPLDALG
ncbi:hypothetical protein EP7_001221 [Isosphaeraceae bacterium EP7]